MKDNIELFYEIQSIFLNDWDPVGIGDNPNLKDEYDGYIGEIVKALTQKASIDFLVEILKKIEKEDICIANTNDKHLYDVALKLKDIYKLYE